MSTGSTQTSTRKSVRPRRRRGFTGGASDVSSSATAGAATSSSGTSTASMITAVMLSSPPAAFAASTRSCAARFGSGSRLEDAGDLVRAHHGGEAVRAEEDAVAGLELDRVLVDVDPGVDAERTRDGRPLGVHLGLLRGEHPVADHLLDEAVVGRDLGERAVAGEVRARIADVPHDQVPVRSQHAGRERRAHAVQFQVGLGLLENGVVRALDGVAQRLTVRHGGAQGLQRGGARDLTGAVAAHAIGDGDQAEAVCLVDEAVLVAVADAADVGDAGGHDLDRAHLVTSATVWPNCTWSPRLRRVTPLICLPFT